MTDNDATFSLITEHVKHLLATMSFSATVDCLKNKSDDQFNRLNIIIKVADQGSLLIGNDGATLNALEHVIRCVLRHKITDPVRVSVDVNGYRAERAQNLARFAEEVAQKATRDGQPIALKAMSPPDRRAIHTALAGRADIRTESLGEEPNRRVLIKPVSQI